MKKSDWPAWESFILAGPVRFYCFTKVKNASKGRIDFCLFTFCSSFCQTPDFPSDAAVCFSSTLSLRPAIVIPLSSLLHLSCHFTLSLFSLFSLFSFFFFKTKRRVPPLALSSTIFLHQCCPPASFLARLALIFPRDLSSLPLSLSLAGPVCLQKVQNDTERPLGVCTDQQHPVWDIQDASERWC